MVNVITIWWDGMDSVYACGGGWGALGVLSLHWDIYNHNYHILKGSVCFSGVYGDQVNEMAWAVCVRGGVPLTKKLSDNTLTTDWQQTDNRLTTHWQHNLTSDNTLTIDWQQADGKISISDDTLAILSVYCQHLTIHWQQTGNTLTLFFWQYTGKNIFPPEKWVLVYYHHLTIHWQYTDNRLVINWNI